MTLRVAVSFLSEVGEPSGGEGNKIFPLISPQLISRVFHSKENAYYLSWLFILGTIQSNFLYYIEGILSLAVKTNQNLSFQPLTLKYSYFVLMMCEISLTMCDERMQHASERKVKGHGCFELMMTTMLPVTHEQQRNKKKKLL